jgi:3',5'-cyclic AMP phosphodiesterase CpdA
MRTIIHLSDLHFGRVDQPTLQPLILAVSAMKPDLVAVSGDLTQRARVEQFKAARSFLNALPGPQIIVPGNHDIPLYNPVLRFSRPLSRFQRYITNDLAPTYLDDEIAVLGVNTARALVIKGGRVNSQQVASIYEQFYRLRGQQTKIIVTHHPFDLPEGFADIDLVGRARMAMENFGKCGVDLFLAGHLHVTHTGSTARYKMTRYSALVIQAGTATSTRGRGELNAFNLIRITPPQISIETHIWQPDRYKFALSQTMHFRRSKDGWISI